MAPTSCMSLGRSLHHPPRSVLLSSLKDGSDITLIVAPVSRAREILYPSTLQGKATMLVLVKAAMADHKVNSTVCFSAQFLSSF